MIPDPVPPVSRPLPVLVRRVSTLVATALLLAQVASAQSTERMADRSAFLQLVERMGGMAVVLVVAAVVAFVLLVWRVVIMVRHERPASLPSSRRRMQREGDDPIDRPSLQRATDWGFDQNKRSAAARSPVTVGGTKVDLPSLDHAVTQWSTTDVNNANNSGVQPSDALGQSPTPTQSPYRTSFNPYFRHDQPANRIEVVEVADALIQAELLVQLGDPKQAMTLLSHHIRDTEKPGAAVWLMLLSLYQSTGREAQYNALASGFRTLFNAEVPAWATSPDVMARELESYPQVMMRLQTTWSGPLARATIDGLLNDDRGGSRQGFSLAAYRELLFLSEILDMIATIASDEEDRQGIQRKLGGFQG
jgi:hypothetical protein